MVKNNNWCFNCLSAKHGVRVCPSEKKCSECSKKHHNLLHLGRPSPGNSDISGISDISEHGISENAAAAVSNVLCSTWSETGGTRVPSTVLLPSAVVNILNSPLNQATARILLDNCSQSHLVTTDCCRKLGLKYYKVNSSVQGVGTNAQAVKGFVNLVIGSRYNADNTFWIRALVVDKITDDLPQVEIEGNNFLDLAGIQLADETYGKPGKIDGIIGTELHPYIFSEGRLKNLSLGKGISPEAQETIFGYVILGRAAGGFLSPPAVLTLYNEPRLEELIKKFWEIEQVPNRPISHPEDEICERIYKENFTRDKFGRFTVALPFKCSPKLLGNSKIVAENRLWALEKRLSKAAELRKEYNRAMKDFIMQGHMRLKKSLLPSEPSYYIAHHPVIKTESTSTPVRIVLDASSPSDNDISLNDVLHCGPKLQTDIGTILLNFRLFKVGVTADIRQMYRQINIVEDHWRFQRVLWRFDPSEVVQVYELTVVAFGVTSSPYLALRTVKQLIEEENEKFPLAAKYISRDLFMDDLVCSTETEDEACQLYNESVGLFAAGRFHLTKWSTNSESLLERIPIGERLLDTVSFKTDTKILGLKWDPQSDELSFRISLPDEKCTKRSILSAVARCYDVIGLLAPFIFFLKLLIKHLWRMKLDWDENPSDQILRIWENLRDEWGELEGFRVPRHLFASKNYPVPLIGFADASQEGYGAVVYMKTQTSGGEVAVNLVSAKSKVAPFKIITIPRLELCAALLLSKLMKHVVETYQERIFIPKIFAFSDSSTVINWLQSNTLKDIFVANRVQQVRENVPHCRWFHVEGKQNPADSLSRGLTPSQLINDPLWLSGPEWLKLSEPEWQISDIASPEKINSFSYNCFAVVSPVETNTEENELYKLLVKTSSWVKLLRITVWVLRFLKITPKRDIISIYDLQRAEKVLTKIVQRIHFGTEIKTLELGGDCPLKFRKLRPFIHEAILRVGGRLSNSDLTFSQQHQVILPAKDKFTENLIDFHHRVNLHAGPQLLEALLRQKYWIIGGRNVIRKRVHMCNRCFRLKPKPLTPLMADLPSHRVRQAKVFLHTGVDYFGPFSITLGKQKKATVHKAYVCLFVCMAVKAVHLELVSSLSTADFLMAFKRFLARRGPCKILYSDQGTNFVGAKTVLRDIDNILNSSEFKEVIELELGLNGVEWKFNTPASPHMEGLWESNVKSAKNHIYRMLRNQLLTYEEFSTLLAQVEAVLNSRPLCNLSSDPSAPEALTPSHFLTLTPLKSLPADEVSDIKLNRLDRYQLIDRFVQEFWKRWRLEYLSTLQVREKWNKTSQNVKIGTVVLLKDDNMPPLHWPLGIIEEIHPGKDGIVRNVTVKTRRGNFNRPVVKVSPLPSQ